VIEETREVSGVEGVELATIGNLYVRQGDREELRIEGDDNLMRYIETRVDDGTLEIESRDRVSLLPREPLYFYLTVLELDSVVLAGLGSIELPDDVQVDSLTIEIRGGGTVEIEDLQADVFEVRISGLGDLYVEDGEVNEQRIGISGGGNYRARGLASDDAEVEVSGLGSATLWARENLEVKISGGGSVRYVGSPSVEQDVSGVGHVERIED
jgi:hypothetical protein